MTQKKSFPQLKHLHSSGAEPYHFLFQHHPIPMLVYDPKTLAILEVNDAAVEHYGYTHDEFLAITIKEIHPPEDVQRLLDDIKKERPELQHSGEWRHILKNGRIIDVEITSHTLEISGSKAVLVVAHDITDRKQMEEANRLHIHFLESLEQIDKVIRQEINIDRMLKNVMERVFGIFNCDRAWLLYPCDPDAQTFRVPMEINRPEYPGANVLNLEVPMDEGVVKDLREALASEDPLTYALGTEKPVNTFTAQQFAVQSQMFMAIYPKIGKPWVFGIHQCSHPRIWTDDEKVLFKEIGRRVADGLSNVLFFHDLRESEERFRTLVNQAADAIFLHDMEGHVLNVNQRACDSLGYNREELIEMNVADLDAEFISRNHVSTFWSQLRHDHPVTLESRHKRKDGTTFPVEVRLGLLQTEGKQSILALARDITERKQAEEELRESEKRFRNLFENSPISLWEEDFSEVKRYIDLLRLSGVKDFKTFFQDHPEEVSICAAKTKLLDINRKTLQLYQARTKEELLAGLSLVFCNESYVEYIQELTAVAEGKSEFECETINMSLTGRKIPIILKWLVAPGYEETLSKVFVSIIDISEHKRAEEALRRSEERFSKAFHDSPLAISISRLDNGQYIDVNERFIQLVGLQRDEIIGKNSFDLGMWVDPELRKTITETLHNKVSIRDIETDFIMKSGNIRTWRSSLEKIETEDTTCILSIINDITEQKLAEQASKQAEETIRKSEQRYRDLVTYAPVGIYQSTRKGDFVTVNARLAEILGYDSAEELMTKNLSKDVYASEEERETAISKLEPIGSVQNLELQWKKKDGSPLWINLSSHLVKSGSEQEAYFEGFVQDITEHKRAEVESHVLFEITQGITTTANLDELFRLIHQSLKKVLYAENCFVALRDPITGLFSFPYFIDQFDPAPLPQSLGKSCSAYVFRTGTPMLITQNDFEQLETQGEVESVGTPSPEWLGVPLRTPLKTIGVLVLQQYEDRHTYTSRDLEFLTSVGNQVAVVIERKQVEKELSTLAHALRNISECVSITDMDNNLLFVNEAFLKTYGYTEEELLGKHISVVDSSNNPPDVQPGVYTATLAGGWRGELLNRRKDGCEFPISLSTSIIRDTKGQPVSLIGVATDITEHKIADEKRKNLEAQLQQAQKLESLGTLASGIAHDFNNLLGIIIGHASLLEHLPADSTIIKKNTDAITKAGMRGASLVKQLLTFARKSDILVEAVRLNDIIVEVSKLLDETFPKTITVTLHLEKQLPSIMADATQVHQVILNLCVNARDAMPNGGILSITTFVVPGERIRTKFPKADAKEYVGLRVTDTGTGMDEATQRRIFEPFFTTKGIGKGTGLGLSLVFGIVESHNGFINLRSEPGKGTTFEIHFPLPLQFVEIEEVTGQSSDESAGGSETILIIEDEELLRELVKGILRSKGYNLLTAEDGEDGVGQYQRHQKEIQLVLSDLGLPKLSGFEAFKRIKTINPDVKFILATGFIDPEDKSTMLEAGIKNIIHKPYSVEAMLRSVRSILDIT